MTESNGILEAPPGWDDLKKKVNDMHAAMFEVVPYIKKLDKLDEIAKSSGSIEASNKRIEDKLIVAATNTNKIDSAVVLQLFLPVFKYLCWGIFLLMVWFTKGQDLAGALVGLIHK